MTLADYQNDAFMEKRFGNSMEVNQSEMTNQTCQCAVVPMSFSFTWLWFMHAFKIQSSAMLLGQSRNRSLLLTSACHMIIKYTMTCIMS